MNDQQEEKRSNKSFGYFIAFAVVLILYPLSIGPYAWLSYHDCTSPEMDHFFESVYSPIIFLCERVEFLENVLIWYIYLWVGISPP